MTKNYKRSGDHNLHEISSLPKGLKKVEHKETFCFGTGEATNHNHVITASKANDFDVYQDEQGRYYFEMFTDDVKIAHVIGDGMQTADHKTIPAKKGLYKQVRERELDWASAIERKVID